MKAAKLIKFGLFALSFASYAYLFSWKFAILILAAIGFHEYGHVRAFRWVGVKTNGFWYIPLVGGVAVATAPIKTYRDQVFVAIMGPVFGFALALVSYGLFLTTHLPIFAAATGWMALINLLNCFPISPLDGGYVLKAISFSVNQTKGVIAVAIVSLLSIFALVKLGIWLFVFFGILGLLETALSYWHTHEHKKFLKVNKETWADIYDRHFSVISESKEEYIAKHAISIAAQPASMSGKEITWSAIAYLGTVFMFCLLLIATKDIPGADIAHTFMADK